MRDSKVWKRWSLSKIYTHFSLTRIETKGIIMYSSTKNLCLKSMSFQQSGGNCVKQTVKVLLHQFENEKLSAKSRPFVAINLQCFDPV